MDMQDAMHKLDEAQEFFKHPVDSTEEAAKKHWIISSALGWGVVNLGSTFMGFPGLPGKIVGGTVRLGFNTLRFAGRAGLAILRSPTTWAIGAKVASGIGTGVTALGGVAGTAIPGTFSIPTITPAIAGWAVRAPAAAGSATVALAAFDVGLGYYDIKTIHDVAKIRAETANMIDGMSKPDMARKADGSLIKKDSDPPSIHHYAHLAMSINKTLQLNGAVDQINMADPANLQKYEQALTNRIQEQTKAYKDSEWIWGTRWLRGSIFSGKSTDGIAKRDNAKMELGESTAALEELQWYKNEVIAYDRTHGVGAMKNRQEVEVQKHIDEANSPLHIFKHFDWNVDPNNKASVEARKQFEDRAKQLGLTLGEATWAADRGFRTKEEIDTVKKAAAEAMARGEISRTESDPTGKFLNGKSGHEVAENIKSHHGGGTGVSNNTNGGEGPSGGEQQKHTLAGNRSGGGAGQTASNKPHQPVKIENAGLSPDELEGIREIVSNLKVKTKDPSTGKVVEGDTYLKTYHDDLTKAAQALMGANPDGDFGANSHAAYEKFKPILAQAIADKKAQEAAAAQVVAQEKKDKEAADLLRKQALAANNPGVSGQTNTPGSTTQTGSNPAENPEQVKLVTASLRQIYGDGASAMPSVTPVVAMQSTMPQGGPPISPNPTGTQALESVIARAPVIGRPLVQSNNSEINAWNNVDPKLQKDLAKVVQDMKGMGFRFGVDFDLVDGTNTLNMENQVLSPYLKNRDATNANATPYGQAAQSAYFRFTGNPNNAQQFYTALHLSERHHGLVDASPDLNDAGQEIAAEYKPGLAVKRHGRFSKLKENINVVLWGDPQENYPAPVERPNPFVFNWRMNGNAYRDHGYEDQGQWVRRPIQPLAPPASRFYYLHHMQHAAFNAQTPMDFYDEGRRYAGEGHDQNALNRYGQHQHYQPGEISMLNQGFSSVNFAKNTSPNLDALRARFAQQRQEAPN